MVGLNRLLISGRVKASSITETIVATTIIIIVFTIAILSLNNVLQNIIENDTSAVERRINELIYKSQYEKIITSDSYEEGDWIVSLAKEKQNNVDFIVIEALNRKTKRKLVKSIIYNEN